MSAQSYVGRWYRLPDASRREIISCHASGVVFAGGLPVSFEELERGYTRACPSQEEKRRQKTTAREASAAASYAITSSQHLKTLDDKLAQHVMNACPSASWPEVRRAIEFGWRLIRTGKRLDQAVQSAINIINNPPPHAA